MSRINFEDNLFETITKFGEGNPGASIALIEAYDKGAVIDPDSAFGELSAFIHLDSNEIYGSDIYILFSDICNRDIVKFLAVLRATQLGLFSKETLKDACSRQDYSGRELVPVDVLYHAVKERLPRFNTSVETVTA